MSAVTAFAVLTFVFAYLAINTPEKHGPLQIGHYILVHVMALFTGYVAYAANAADSSLEGLLASFLGSYSYLVYLVAAYFGIFMLVKAIEFFKTDQ